MRLGFLIILLLWNSIALGKQSLLRADIRIGDLKSRYEITLKGSAKSIHWETSNGDKQTLALSQKDYDFILGEFRKLKSPELLPEACHRQSVHIKVNDSKSLEKRSCLNLRTISEPSFRRFINLLHLTLIPS